MKSIYKYIAFDLASPNTALGQITRIEAAIKGLSQMPERFQRYRKGVWGKRNLRIMPVDHYCVFYVF